MYEDFELLLQPQKGYDGNPRFAGWGLNCKRFLYLNLSEVAAVQVLCQHKKLTLDAARDLVGQVLGKGFSEAEWKNHFEAMERKWLWFVGKSLGRELVEKILGSSARLHEGAADVAASREPRR